MLCHFLRPEDEFDYALQSFRNKTPFITFCIPIGGGVLNLGALESSLPGADVNLGGAEDSKRPECHALPFAVGLQLLSQNGPGPAKSADVPNLLRFRKNSQRCGLRDMLSR